MKTTNRKVRALRVINQATTRSRIGKARRRQTATREAPNPGTPGVGAGTSSQRDEREQLAPDPKKKLGQEYDDAHRDDE